MKSSMKPIGAQDDGMTIDLGEELADSHESKIQDRRVNQNKIGGAERHT